MHLAVCGNSQHHRDRDERKTFFAVAAEANVWPRVRASGKILKWWKMTMPSFRLEILGSLTRETTVLEKVEQLGHPDATALKKSTGLGILEAAVWLKERESVLAAW